MSFEYDDTEYDDQYFDDEGLDDAIRSLADRQRAAWLIDKGDRIAFERFLEEYEAALWAQEGAYFYVPISVTVHL